MSIDHDQRWRARALFALQALVLGCAPETGPTASRAPAALPEANPLGGETAFAEAEGAPAAEESPVTAVRYLSSVNQPVPPKERVAWPNGAKPVPADKLGSITGEVYDAVTDKPIALGTVETAATCTGAGCASASAVSAGKTIAMLSNGVFTFDAHAASPAKLALEGDSAFIISASGYQTIVFAHGPHGSTAASDGKAVTKFRRLYLCPAGAADNDSDGICDAAELKYGTDPQRADSDKDAFSDLVELYGAPISEGYALDVAGLGLSPTHLDVVVEVDYMPARAPMQEAIDAVVNAFRAAPVVNQAEREQSHGIELHVFIDQEVNKTTEIDADSLSEAISIRDEYQTLRAGIPIHYALFGTTMWQLNEKTGLPKTIGSSGRTDDIPGDMFVVTLGKLASDPVSVAGTFMHELGHNLGLFHGGDKDVDWHPSYISIMNYLYQMTGVPRAGVGTGLPRIDYARGSFEKLFEASLNERAGLVQVQEASGSDELQVVYEPQRYDRLSYCRRPSNGDCVLGRFRGQVPGSINFDRRPGIRTDTTADLDGNGSIGDTFYQAPSDWRTLRFTGLASGGINRAVHEITPCAPASQPVFEEDPEDTGDLEMVPPSDPSSPATPVQRSSPSTPAASSGSTPTSASGTGAYSLPPDTGAFDYQIAGRYAADARVSIVSSNATLAGDQPLDTGRYNICYLNALQTQAEDYNYWTSNYPDLILVDAAGEPVHDPDPEWAGELLFDISTDDKRTRLLELQRAWITGCRDAGFKAIEPDNLDSYSRAGGAFSADAAAQYMQQFVAEAHAQGLAVAQKNAAEWARDGRAASVGFDFAIIEECQLTGECDSVIAHYGAARVFEIEYVYDTADSSSGVSVAAGSSAHFDQACAARGGSVRLVLRNRDVRSANASGYVFQLCGEGSGTTPVMESQPDPAPGSERVPEDGEPPAPPVPDGDEPPESEEEPPPPGEGEPEPQDPLPGEPEPQDPWPEEESEPQDPLPGESEPQDPWPEEESEPQDPLPGEPEPESEEEVPPSPEPEEEEPEEEEP